jgi:hypothetical protein
MQCLFVLGDWLGEPEPHMDGQKSGLLSFPVHPWYHSGSTAARFPVACPQNPASWMFEVLSLAMNDQSSVMQTGPGREQVCLLRQGNRGLCTDSGLG